MGTFGATPKKLPAARLANRPLKPRRYIDVYKSNGELSFAKVPCGSSRPLLRILRNRLQFPEHAFKLVDSMGRIQDLQHGRPTDDCRVVLDYGAFAQRANEISDVYDSVTMCAMEPFPGLCYCCKDSRLDAREREDDEQCQLCSWSQLLCDDCMIYDCCSGCWHCAECLFEHRLSIAKKTRSERRPALVVGRERRPESRMCRTPLEEIV